MAHNAGSSGEAPLQGVVLCCTALAQEIRTNLADIATKMGAVHKLDLTSDVTHLVVGSIDTPKYRYVAKDRPDICALSPGFINAVREAWIAGGEVDVGTLQQEHTLPAFYGLKLCVTGFDDQTVRRQLEETIRENGAAYTGDLVRQVTHLIAAKPEGAKYTHAKQWGIKVVSLKWLEDSLVRGMALDEGYYRPETPLEQQGLGAYRTEPRRPNLAKRSREVEQASAGEKDGPRKMRRTASRRLEGQSQDLWKSVSEHEVQVDATESDMWNEESQTLRDDSAVPRRARDSDFSEPTQHDSAKRPAGLFAGFHVLIHGFDAKRKDMLFSYLEPNGAVIVDSPEALQVATSNAFFKSPILLMPHAAPTKLPAIPVGTILVTEWWIERCIHFKQCLDPQEDALSQPYANASVPAFKGMTISTTGFDSVDLRQTAKVMSLMGATYQEQLQSSTSVLVSGSKSIKKEKAIYASKHRIPVVGIEWLWDSLKSKETASVEQYRISLPAFDTSEYSGSPAASDPSPNIPPQLRKPGESFRRADDSQPKRLSNTRKRHATPRLIVKPSNGNVLLQSSGPIKANKIRKHETGPFILEDEDDDVEPAALLENNAASLNAPIDGSQDRRKGLREISPNTSQHRVHDDDGSNGLANDTEDPTVDISERETVSAQHSPRRSPSKDNNFAPIQPSHKLTNELAEILKRQSASGSSNTTAPTKRKSRPLGRNISSISSRSGSVAAPPSVPSDVFEENPTADGFDYSKAVPALPPSTQLGYDTPEAEAHRKQMSEKMGTNMLQDDGMGRRVASVGTVKDSTSRSAMSGRSKGRSRTKI